MKINELEKEIEIILSDDNSEMIIRKIKTKRINNVSYDDMIKFILNNVEYTHNVAKCINDFINDMGEFGCKEDIFYMEEDQEHFRITTHFEILNVYY